MHKGQTHQRARSGKDLANGGQELEPLSQHPSVALSAGAAISGCFASRQNPPSTRFHKKAKTLAFFLANFFGKKNKMTGLASSDSFRTRFINFEF
ncbi:MAG: hypothetical protein ACHQT8_04795 [Chlamydiales bacterium]